jgi:uncharacterized membrane protein
MSRHLAEFIIVDLGTNDEAGKQLEIILDRYSSAVYDWIEEGKKMTIFARVPKYNRTCIRMELDNLDGVTYDE